MPGAALSPWAKTLIRTVVISARLIVGSKTASPLLLSPQAARFRAFQYVSATKPFFDHCGKSKSLWPETISIYNARAIAPDGA
jgi:hypothetical protein